MIFVTVGSAFPFDRLIRAMDAWACGPGQGIDTRAQIGRGKYRPAHMNWCVNLSEADFVDTVRRASLVVSHAGMGTFITAMRHQTPIVMLPRQFEHGEHTTDHQMATARWLEAKSGVFTAWNEEDLVAKIAEAQAWSFSVTALSPSAPTGFTGRLHLQLLNWINS